MSGGALARLERVLVLVPWLLDHPGATYDEIAERFDTTPEEVASDLDTLGYCGLPGYGGGDLIEVATMGDAVTVRMADYFTRPLRLSLREAVTMLLAVRTLAQVEGLAGSTSVASALDRLETMVGAGAAVDHGAVNVALDLTAEGDVHLPVLRRAIAGHRVVTMTYRSASKQETTVRDVEPWWLVAEQGSWYLRGWCRLAHAPRDFRLDRIVELAEVDDRAPQRPGRSHRPAPSYQPAPDDPRVVLRIRRPSWWVLDRLVIDDIDEQGEWRVVTLRTAELGWLARQVATLGSDVQVEAPDDLRRRVRHRASALLEHYDRPPPDLTLGAEGGAT